MKRYVKEYAADLIRDYAELIKRYPENTLALAKKIERANNTVNQYYKGLITARDAMRILSE